LRNRKFCWIQY